MSIRFSFNDRICYECQRIYVRKCSHALHGTGLCDACFDKEYQNVKTTEDEMRELAKKNPIDSLIKEIEIQVEKVRVLADPSGSARKCIEECTKMISMLVEIVKELRK